MAVNGGAVAIPSASVPTYASRDPLLAKMPLAPVPGASKLTVAINASTGEFIRVEK